MAVPVNVTCSGIGSTGQHNFCLWSTFKEHIFPNPIWPLYILFMTCVGIIEMEANLLKIEIEIPFQNERIAQIAYDVLRVDKEPKRSEVEKVLSAKENILIAHFTARFARQLRVAVNGFFEKLDLVSGSVELLGPPVSKSYSHY